MAQSFACDYRRYFKNSYLYQVSKPEVNDEAMNHESAPLISIIIAVFNGKTTLQQCIDSVAQQTYPNKELIVIDGGSEDGTVDLLNANGGQDRLLDFGAG